MTEIQNPNKYNLEKRTLNFAKSVRMFVKKLSKTIANIEDSKQVVRSSGSIGANYIEANESLSKKDFILRIKICRKEAKETCYWLRLVDMSNNEEHEIENKDLISESSQLMKIFGAILEKSK
jgi:four helix bundle protein